MCRDRLRLVLREIASGEDSARQRRPSGLLRRLPAGEDGMLTFLSVIAILFFLALFAFVANVGLTVNNKIEVQNAADASAYSSALWMARGMNAITATNHLMGEVMSFVVLHAAINEQTGDDQKKQDYDDRIQRASQWLELAQTFAENSEAKTGTPAWDDAGIGDDVENDEIKELGAMLRDGKLDLMRALTNTYIVKGIGGLLEQLGWPPLVALGYALEGLSLVIEIDIIIEWTVLDGAEIISDNTEELRDLLLDPILPMAASYEQVVTLATPALADAAARKIAEENRCRGALYPLRNNLKLHVVEDKYWEQGSNPDIRLSQFVRATYPWVKFHRRPILDVLNWLKLSHAARYYVYWSNEYTKKKVKEFYDDGDNYLLVMVDSTPQQKGREPWTNDTVLAEKMFTVIAFTHRKTPQGISPAVFGTVNDDGLVGYAQAMLYNANNQSPANTIGRHQPAVGWDTLNWADSPAYAEAYECPTNPHPDENGLPRDPGIAPKIKLNWQAKLIPVSSTLNSAVMQMPAEFKNVLKRMTPVSQQFQTH